MASCMSDGESSPKRRRTDARHQRVVQELADQGNVVQNELWQRIEDKIEKRLTSVVESMQRALSATLGEALRDVAHDVPADAMAGSCNVKLSQLPSRVKLDVGGKVFATSLSTLTSVKGTFFDSMFGGRWPLTPEADGSFFIDRDPKGFSLILKCLRSERIDERSVCAEKMAAFRQDVEYYGLPDELVNKSLGRMEEPEVFSSVDHSDGVVLSSTNTAATFCRDENCRMGWVLGTNSYGGHDRVLITLRIERGNDMTFGVMCGRPRIFQCFGYSSALSFSDCDESDVFLSFQPDDIIEVELDCKNSKLTVRNTTRNRTESMAIPSDKQWRLHVNLEGEDCVSIVDSRYL